MARTVADATALLGAMAASDSADPATADADNRGSTDYSAHLKPDGLRDARTGVLRASMGFHPGVDAVVRSEEHTSELHSLMRIPYAVFCLNKKDINPIMYSSYVVLRHEIHIVS